MTVTVMQYTESGHLCNKLRSIYAIVLYSVQVETQESQFLTAGI